MVTLRSEPKSDSVEDVFPPLTEELINTTWCISDPLTFQKLAGATWFIQEPPGITDLATAFPGTSHAVAKIADILVDTIPRVLVWDCALKTPLRELENICAPERGLYYSHYAALLMNKLSAEFRPLLPESFAWGERTEFEPYEIVQPWRRSGPPLSVVARILTFSDLPAGWDGYDGKSVDGQTVERALGLLNDLYGRAATEQATFDAPVLGPTPGGSIQLEWNLPDAFLAVEIPRPSEPLSFYLEYAVDREAASDEASPEDVWNAVKVAFGV